MTKDILRSPLIVCMVMIIIITALKNFTLIRRFTLLPIMMFVLLLLFILIGWQLENTPLQRMSTYTLDDSFSLPIFSFITDPDNLWSQEKGIYVLGQQASPNYHYKGANYWQDWQVPVEIEYSEAGNILYKASAGLKIFGGETRTLPQKSFALAAKKKYGTKTFTYPFFPDKSLQEYKSFILRNGGQDFAKTHMVDGLIAYLIRETHIDYQAYRPVNVFLNGEYWGIYDLREKIDADFLAANHEIKKKDIDLLEADALVKAGKKRDYLQLVEFINTHHLAVEDNYAQVLEWIDLDNFMDYLITEVYIANSDWPDHNIRFWKAEAPKEKWRWILYDCDLSFTNYKENSLARLLAYQEKSNDTLSISFLFRELLKNEKFRADFYTRCQYHLAYTFQPTRVLRAITTLKGQLEPDMDKHLQRWGGSMEEWEKNIHQIELFAEQRPAYFQQQLQSLYATFK